MSIATGIAATKATLDLAQKVTDLVKRPNIDAADVQAKLHELLIHAVNAQAALGEAQGEMADLRRQLDNQEELKKLAADLEMDLAGHYYVLKSEKERGVIPYCPTCWGTESKLVPLTLVHRPGQFACAIHHTVYKTAAHLEDERRIEEENSRRPRRSGGWMG